MTQNQKRYRDSCKAYKPGDDKCQFFCGRMDKDPEPWCYNPIVVDQDEWDRIDKALREFVEKSGSGGEKK